MLAQSPHDFIGALTLFLAFFLAIVVIVANLALTRPVMKTILLTILVAIWSSIALLTAIASLIIHSTSPWPYLSALTLGVVPIIFLVPRFQAILAKVMPITPGNPVHSLALSGTCFLALSSILALGSNGGAPVLSGSIQWLDILANLALFVVAALLGVGMFVRRSSHQVLERLGILPFRPHYIFLGIFASLFFVGVATGLDALSQWLTPELSKKITESSKALFDPIISTGPGLLLLAISAGAGEELFFRGALQPRFGIIVTTLLFASLHVQYGFSFALATVFILALMLGWLRTRAGLITCIVAHGLYDFIGGLNYTYPPVIIGLTIVGFVGAVSILYKLRQTTI